MTLQLDKDSSPTPEAEVSPYPLFDLTRAITDSRTTEDIYNAALNCLRDSLAVSKASILLFDPDAVMRFKAWFNLSPEYRQAVEGHTPWTPETKDPQPVLVPDVREEPSLEHLCPAIEAEGIRALAFFPMTAGNRLLGKFMLYYPEPHELTRQEILIAQTIAAHVAFALDRHEIRQERREQHEHLVGIFRSPVVGIAEVDASGSVVTVNDRFCEIAGRSREELVGGLTVYDFTHPDDMEETSLGYLGLRDGGTHFSIEKRYVRPDGTDVWVSNSVSATHDEAGRFTGAIAVVTDISRRLEGEQRRIEGERRYRELMEAMNVAVYTTDINGFITYYNEAAAEGWGRRPELGVEQWCGSWQILTPDGENVPLDECPMATSLKEDRPIRGVELLVERPDGTRLNVLPHPTPLHDANGVLVGAVNVFVDITQRKQTELALKESEERLKVELAGTQRLQEAGAKLINEDDVNAVYEELLDAAIAIMDSDLASMQMLHPERGTGGELKLLGHRGFTDEEASYWEWVNETSGSSCARALSTGRRAVISDMRSCEFLTDEQRDIMVNGGILAAQSTPLISRNGKLLGMISTHWRRPHEPLERDLRLMDVLARQAADLIERSYADIALRESAEQLRAAAQLKDEFLGLVSHELRTPISTILGNGLLLVRHWGTIPQDDRQQALSDIASEAEKLQEIIENLLLITRMEAGHLDSEPLAIQRLVEDSIDDFKRMHSNRIVSFTSTDNLVPALGEPTLVPLIMRNLLSNADKYSPADKPIEVCLRLDSEANTLEVAVRDYGIGLAPADLDTVFEPFYRSQRSRNYAKGMGLGLAVCKRVTEAQGGRIWVEPQQDAGVRFVFQLRAVTALDLAE